MKTDETLCRIKSVAGTLAFRVMSLGVAFFTVPLLLQLLGKEGYGIWATYFSVTSWLVFWDLGTGFGFKNQLAGYAAVGNQKEARRLIAANIQFYICITVALLICFCAVCFFVEREQLTLVCFLYLPLIISFPSSIGLKILQSYRKYHVVNWFGFLQSALFLLSIFLFSFACKTAIVSIGLIYSTIYALLNISALLLAAHVCHFRWLALGKRGYFKEKYLKLKTAIIFFVHEVTNVVIYFSGNLIVYSQLTATETARFDVVNKLFLIGISFFNSLLNIYWTEISHAIAQRDEEKLRGIRKKLYGLSGLFAVGVIISLFIAPVFIPFWTKGAIQINVTTLLPFGISIILQIFNNAACVFLGAFEKMKTITIMYVVLAALMIPLCSLFFSQGYNIGSVPLAAGLLTIPSLVYALIHAEKCIRIV